MRKIGFTLFAAVLGLMVFSTSAQAQDWSESDLQELYMKFLEKEGIEGWIDSDGDVQFEYNDRSYFIEVNEDDNEFFRVVLFNIWPIESQTEAIQVALACDAVNREMKVAKAYTTNDNVWIACELFVGNPSNFKPVFLRCLSSIESGVDTFVGEM